MDLNLVNAFSAVADAGSFTAAARTLGVPTSSVSRAVARLEERLRVKLFERTTRRTRLTTPGRAYLAHARAALEALQQGEAALSELTGEARGLVTLTTPINLDDGFLARQLVLFMRRNPRVRLHVIPTNAWLTDGFDLALRVQPQTAASHLLLRELGTFAAWIVAAPEYLASRPRPRRPADLRAHDWVNMQAEMQTITLMGPRGPARIEVSGPVFANDMQLARQLVEQGAGIGPLVFPPGQRRVLPKGLVRVLPDYVVAGPSLYLASGSLQSQPLGVRRLRDHLIAAYAQPCRTDQMR